ncbi:SPOR domain-containing protein [Orbaceae bacterium ac157xtp]
MSNSKRNQLIGFITLILIILIFSPYLFINKSKQLESTIPLLNSSQFVDEPSINSDIQINAPELTQTESQQPHQNTTITAVEPTQNLTNDEIKSESNTKKEQNYVIQLVALKNKQKIEELIALLKLNNYDVFTIPSKPIDGQLTRLIVGPFASKRQAELVMMDLNNLTKLNGFISAQ